MEHTFDDAIVSDLYKDVNGCRPGAIWMARWRAMAPEAKQAEWDYLCNALESEIAREAAAEARAKARWEGHIAQLMADNGIDRPTALRWDMEAMDCNGDVGFYCYLWGMDYGLEATIQEASKEPA
jgi:hypothetical protein